MNPRPRFLCYDRVSVGRRGAQPVAYYRLYFMDPRSGHITAYESIEAADDEAATAGAERHRGWQPLELWCQGRKVYRLEAVAATTPRQTVD